MQHNNTQHGKQSNATSSMTISMKQSIVMLSISYAQYHIQAPYAERHYADFHYANCCGAG
jgi:hypothetical protein